MRNNTFKMKELLFGAAYYLEYMPSDRIDEDMRLIKEANMNVIRIGESTWSTWEPTEGHFDFSLLDRMLDASEQYDLKVIVGTPTYAIPSWLCKKYPDILAVTHSGTGLYGHRQNMDITHAGYLKHSEIIIRKMLSHIQHRRTIIGFQLDNETKSYDTSGPNVQKMFVEQLRKNFPSIDDFNLEFGLNYWSNRIQTWEDFPDIRGSINGSLSGEFKKFQRSLVTHFLTWQSNIVKEYATNDQFITHNSDYCWKAFSYGMQPEVNQYEAAIGLTLSGCDIYHPSQDDLTGIEISFGGAIARSIKHSNYLVLETQAQGNISWLPYPGQLSMQAFSHLASGANSVMYWNWHSIHNAIESYWKGVLSHDLCENATYQEAVIIGSQLNQYGSKLVNLKKECCVAIIIDNHSLTGIQEFSLESGTPANSGNAFDYNDILRWIHDAFYNLNIECDILHCSDVIEHSTNSTDSLLSNYQLVVAPALYSASEQLLHHLDDFVLKGGHLLTTFKSGFSNEKLKIYHDTQPHILNKCCGVTYQQFTIPNKVQLSIGGTVNHWIELLMPTTAETWANYKHPHWGKYAAITHNLYGEGSATYLGCHFDSTVLEEIITKLCMEINLPLSNLHFPIICKKGTNDFDKEICYYFNYSDVEQHFTSKSPAATNIFTGEMISPEDSICLKPWNFIITES